MTDTEATTDRDALIDRALARGVLYGAAVWAFRHPAARGDVPRGDPGARETIAEAARLLDAAVPEVEPLLPAVRSFTEALAQPREIHVSRYERLFGHTARGMVCPYETEFGSDAAYGQPQALADIAGYYRAFGLRCAQVDERIDHVGCECAFMEFLALKEAVAVEGAAGAAAEERQTWRDTLEATRGAERTFFRDHLGRFGRAFAAALSRADGEGLLGCTGAFLFGLLEAEWKRLGVACGPDVLPLRSAAEEPVPMGCGGGEQSGCGEGPSGCGDTEPLIQIRTGGAAQT